MKVFELPFVCVNEEGVDLWSVEPTGEWETDNTKGSHFADLIAGFGEPVLLPNVVKAIVEKGSFGGVEVGFFHRLGERIVNQKYPRLTPVDIEKGAEINAAV